MTSPQIPMLCPYKHDAWWRHQMEIFSALLALCAGNSPVTGELPAQRPVARSFDVFSDLCLNKRLSKQSWGWWFETLSHPLWRHCNVKLESSISRPLIFKEVLLQSMKFSELQNKYVIYALAKYNANRENLVYLFKWPQILARSVCDILICWKSLGTSHKQVLWL